MKRKVAIMATIVTGAVLLLAVGIFAGPSENAAYVGSSKCKKCHMKPFRSWQKTAHAQSFETLKMMGREQDAECVKCHSTGFGEAGGFVDSATTSNLENTGCESCHGAGSEHLAGSIKDKELKRATINKSPGGACVKCHNPHMSTKMKMDKEALPVLKKKLEELQKLIAALEAQ